MYRYSYDGAGNLAQVKNDSQTQVLRSYSYTPTGLLDTASFKDKDGNSRTLSNSWNADSNRVSFNANGTEYELVYDPTAGIPAVLHEHCGGAGNDGVYYIREPGGELIARVRPTEGIRYYHFDELGSTRLLTDANGTVTDRYAYDAYGSLLSHDRYTGSVKQPYQYVGQLGYYTHWMEPDFGLLQLGVRFYDPEAGRFTQRDPLFDEAENPAYLYCSGRPLTGVDPTGLATWKCPVKVPKIPRWMPPSGRYRIKHDWCYACRVRCVANCLDKYVYDKCKEDKCVKACQSEYSSCLLRKKWQYKISLP